MRPLSFSSRKWTLSSPKEPSKVGHGWNLYVVDTVTPLALYQEMVRLLLLWRTALFLYANCKAVSSHVPKPGVLLSFTVHLCLAQVEYSQHYAESTQAHSLWHLLSEAHILLRASLLHRGAKLQSSERDAAECQQTDPQKQKDNGELDKALSQNCAQLGDCFSRSDRGNPWKRPSRTSWNEPLNVY